MKDGNQIFLSFENFIPCMAWILLLVRNVEFVRIRSALTFDALARWSVDLLQVSLPLGELLPGLMNGPGCPAVCGAAAAYHKMQSGFFQNSGFASGFFEGKPRSKNKQYTSK